MDLSTLLIRVMHDVLEENDPERRRAAMDQLFHQDAEFYKHATGTYRGHNESDRIAGAFRASHPDFRYHLIADPEVIDEGGRARWVSGRPSEAPFYAGTDFTISRDGRIAAVYLPFDKVP
jgi:hypothetical protein